jgi:hypothetical protein
MVSMAVVVTFGVAEPALHQIEGEALADGRDAEGVPQALGAGVGGIREAGRLHHLVHAA